MTSKCDVCGETPPEALARHLSREHTDECPWRNKDMIRKLHYGEGLSAEEIADRYDTYPELIYRWWGQLHMDGERDTFDPYIPEPVNVLQDWS